MVDGEVDARGFEWVIDRYLVEAPNVTGDAHKFEDAIEMKEAESLRNPGAYLFKYLGKSWDVGQIEDYEKRFVGLIFDQEVQRFRALNEALRWMQRDEDESETGEWMFTEVASDEQAWRTPGIRGVPHHHSARRDGAANVLPGGALEASGRPTQSARASEGGDDRGASLVREPPDVLPFVGWDDAGQGAQAVASFDTVLPERLPRRVPHVIGVDQI